MVRIDLIGSMGGDCLAIAWGAEAAPRRMLVDGGPPGTYRRHLRPYLRSLRAEGRPPAFELAMVSHIDSDHIAGLLELTGEMIREEDGDRDPAQIARVWFNGFDDLTGGGGTAALSALSDAVIASAAAGGQPPFAVLGGADHRAQGILAGLAQGRRFRDQLVTLGLDGNRPFGDTLVMAGKAATLPGGAEIAILGPDHARLADLQAEWNPALDPAEIAQITDRSVSNLSSIVCLLEVEGARILLTGDARGDDILTWAEDAGLMAPGERLHLDVLKVPHHGSEANVDEAFFGRLTADTYLFCGDGSHDNPEPVVLAMLRRARAARDPGAHYAVAFSDPVRMQHGEKQPDFEAELAALSEAGATVRVRDPDALSLEIRL